MNNDLEKKVMRKVTLRIIPFIMLLYFIAFLDRVNIGFAALTMNEDLSFSPTVFGLGAGIFFLGYFLFEVPSNLKRCDRGAATQRLTDILPDRKAGSEFTPP